MEEHCKIKHVYTEFYFEVQNGNWDVLQISGKTSYVIWSEWCATKLKMQKYWLHEASI